MNHPSEEEMKKAVRLWEFLTEDVATERRQTALWHILAHFAQGRNEAKNRRADCPDSDHHPQDSHRPVSPTRENEQ